jgi:Protein of unknown function (DUF2569)
MTIPCTQCAFGMEESATVCTNCSIAALGQVQSLATRPSPEDSLPAPPVQGESSTTPPMFATRADLEGIGGWLIFIAIGLAISPFSCLHGVYRDLGILYGSRYQPILTARRGFAGLILYEAVTNTIFFLATVVLNFLLYRKKKLFPGLMIMYTTGHFLSTLIDHFAARELNSSTSPAAVERGLLAAMIWIPYFLRLERVKSTFVN